MNNESDILEKINLFFKENPQYFAVFLVGFGVFMLLAAIKNWEWVFSGSSYNTQKLEGISNMWGRGIARLMAGSGGIFCIIGGVVWFMIPIFY